VAAAGAVVPPVAAVVPPPGVDIYGMTLPPPQQQQQPLERLMDVPHTLVVASDDTSVVSQITLDIRLIDDHELPTTAARRPGPENSESVMDNIMERPGRNSWNHYYHHHHQYSQHYPPPNNARSSGGGRLSYAEQVIREEEEGYEENVVSAPLGLHPSAIGPMIPGGGGGGSSWDQEVDIDKMLRSSGSNNNKNNNNSNKKKTCRNITPSRASEIIVQPRDIVMDTPLAAAEAPAPAIADCSPPQFFSMSRIEKKSKQPSTMDQQELTTGNVVEKKQTTTRTTTMAAGYDNSGPNRGSVVDLVTVVDPPSTFQQQMQTTTTTTPSSKAYLVENQTTTTSSTPPPLREINARGRADSGKILDPNQDLEKDEMEQAPSVAEEVSSSSSSASSSAPPRITMKPVSGTGKKGGRTSSKRRSKKGEPRGMAARAVERIVDPSTSKRQDPPVTMDNKINNDDDNNDDNDHSYHMENNNGILVTKSSTKAPKKKEQTKHSSKKKQIKKRLEQQQQHKQDMYEIPAIMHCLNLEQCDSRMRERALDALAAILWRSSSKGREFIQDHQGVDTLTKSMWADMDNPQVQGAAMHLILAMAASPDGNADNDMLSREESICDSVLFTMQNHSANAEIQLRGCLIFSCLAAASSDNKTISDGSLSNAVQMVLNAMENHPLDCSIQKAGIQALYHQCLASVHAEGNKRSLMESKLVESGGVLGVEVVLRAMEELQDDYIAMEWACSVCWCLTSSEDLVKSSANMPLPEAVVPICMQHIANPAAASLVEAALGAIGNLAHLDKMHKALIDVGAVGMITEALQVYPNDFGINYEAVAAIANLSFSSFARESFIKSGTVHLTVTSVDRFLDIPAFAEEGLRALVGLLIGSNEAKVVVTSIDIVKTIAYASERHDTLIVQQLCCSLVATLAVDAAVCDLLVGRGAVGLCLSAMDNYPDLKVQEAGCAALRNMFYHTLLTDGLLEDGDTERLMVSAMSLHKNSITIQINSCCALWNMIYKSEDSAKIVTTEGVKCIVKAMQCHMECSELVEQACGALWTIVHDSMERKKEVVANGAIDAVTCAMVMHPEAPETLEKACGVLSNVSSEPPLAEAIAHAQGVTIVAEALRNNPMHLPLLEVGCLTLRNIAFVLPDVASEATTAIATIVNAMQDNIHEKTFLREACNLLWILASEDESCHAKILALDGLSVLMKCLEENREDSELQTAALGAFNKLSFSIHESG
jgi:hypothetical protein